MKASFLSMLLAALALATSGAFAATAPRSQTVVATESGTATVQLARRGADDATTDDRGGHGGDDLVDGCDDNGNDTICL